MPKFERILMSIALAFLKDEKLFLTKPVKEILFDGYSDPILTLGDDLAAVGIHLPGLTSKFGLFFGRNDTWYTDGITKIHTGASGLNHLGQVISLNGSETNPVFKGDCGKYQGNLLMGIVNWSGVARSVV